MPNLLGIIASSFVDSVTPPGTTEQLIDVVPSGVTYLPGVFDLLGSSYDRATRIGAGLVDVTLYSNGGTAGGINNQFRYAIDAGEAAWFATTDGAADRWIAFDLGPHLVVSLDSSYWVRGRDSFLMRNWNLEVSDDAVTWTPVDVRVADATMVAGSTWYEYTMTAPDSAPHRFVRLLSTGLNSGASSYLTLEEIELYGTVTDTVPVPLAGDIDLRYRHGLTAVGVIEYLGKLRDPVGGTRINPERRGLVECGTSAKAFGFLTYNILSVVTTDQAAVTMGGWGWQVDLGSRRRLRADHYRFGTWAENAGVASHSRGPFQWTLQGSNDGTTWDLLDDRTLFDAMNYWLEDYGRTLTVGCQVVENAYRFFRFTPTVAWQPNDWCAINQLELYGVLTEEDPTLVAGATRHMPAGDVVGLDGIVSLGGVTPTVSSSSGGTAAGLINGNATWGTGWQSAAIPSSWAKLDFGVDRSVRPEIVGLGSYPSDDYVATKFTIQGSNDDAAWTDLYVSDGATTLIRWGSGAFMAFIIGANTSYQYLRVLTPASGGVSPNGADYLTLSEIEVWGDLVLPPVTYGWQLTDTNTGLAGVGVDRDALPEFSGTISDGQTISNMAFTSGVDLSALTNVTLDRVWIHPTDGSMKALILGPGTVIRDSDLDGTLMGLGQERFGICSETSIGTVGNYTIERCNLTNMVVGLYLDSANDLSVGTVTDTYVHEMTPAGDGHIDGFTRRAGGGPLTLTRVRIAVDYPPDGGGTHATGAFFLQNTFGGDIAGVRIVDSYLEGNGHPVVLEATVPNTTLVEFNNVRLTATENPGQEATNAGATVTEWVDVYIYDALAPNQAGAVVPSP